MAGTAIAFKKLLELKSRRNAAKTFLHVLGKQSLLFPVTTCNI